MEYKQIFIIIPAGIKVASDNTARKINPMGGENFSVPLYKNGVNPKAISHWGCSWFCTAEEQTFLEANFDEVFNGNDVTFEEVLEAKGLARWVES